MSTDTAVSSDNELFARRKSGWRRFLRVFLNRGLVVVGLIIILLIVLTAIFAPWLAPYNPNEQNVVNSLHQPDRSHWLGTDAIGRDILSRVIYGARTSLFIGIVVVFISAVLGMALGLIAGYFGGWLYTVIMRFFDAMMAFPMLVLALLVAAMLGSGISNVIIALSVSLIPIYARLMCGQVVTVRENDYITAGRSIGASNLRMMMSHVLPNCFPPLIVMITMMLGSVILAEAGLSFLGIGISPTIPSWGGMVNDGQDYLLRLPLLSFAPGLAIMLIVFGFNMVGDGLRDALDPRLRGML
jgi:ABC-type dipeptide/oligopeptide/nickel transport system permease subunit